MVLYIRKIAVSDCQNVKFALNIWLIRDKDKQRQVCRLTQHRAKILFALAGFIFFLTGAGLKATASITSHVPSPKPQTLAALSNGQDMSGELKPLPVPSSVLSDKDSQLYKKIFDLQENGNWDAADRLISDLSDDVLMGHVLYQRYMHPTAYTSTYPELQAWLKKYRDHPGADKIYKIASRRHIKDYKGPLKPQLGLGTYGGYDMYGNNRAKPIPPQGYNASQRAHVRKVVRQIESDLSKGRPTAAWNKLNTEFNRDVLSDGDFDRLRAEIAQSLFYHGKVDEAMAHAKAAFKRTGERAPLAGWIAGLVSWQRNQPSKAAVYFESVADTEYASPWTVSAGAYWAYRAHEKSRNRSGAKKYLKTAAEFPYTFYGVLAHSALGRKNFVYNWDMDAFLAGHFKTLEKNDIGRRAIALLKVGNRDLAEAELKQISVDQDSDLRKAVVSLAHHWNMPALSLQLAGALKNDDGSLMDPSLYPSMPWAPKGGFEIDRALVKAFVRQESRFDPKAISHSGAVGLMQLMPTTASYVAGENPGAFKTKQGKQRLAKPEYNLSLGQQYISTLLRDQRISGNLFKLMVSYNAGPNRMARWTEELDHKNDPLFFIEAIPAPETRAFVERVMTNYWIYRIRMGQQLPTLASVVDGGWPIYVAQDAPSRLQVASN